MFNPSELRARVSVISAALGFQAKVTGVNVKLVACRVYAMIVLGDVSGHVSWLSGYVGASMRTKTQYLLHHQKMPCLTKKRCFTRHFFLFRHCAYFDLVKTHILCHVRKSNALTGRNSHKDWMWSKFRRSLFDALRHELFEECVFLCFVVSPCSADDCCCVKNTRVGGCLSISQLLLGVVILWISPLMYLINDFNKDNLVWCAPSIIVSLSFPGEFHGKGELFALLTP